MNALAIRNRIIADATAAYDRAFNTNAAALEAFNASPKDSASASALAAACKAERQALENLIALRDGDTA